MATPRVNRLFITGAAALVITGLAVAWVWPASADPAVAVPAYQAPVAVTATSTPVAVTATSETATLSGGCFWGMQGVYEHVKGVTRVVAGYTGGAADTAQYEVVSTGTTGHAESVQITFNPQIISYAKLLQIYFSVAADPTELNYQGPDTGTQYRSEIWVATPAQRAIAAGYIAQLDKAKVFSAPIVVRVDVARPFYPAESYHQDFLVRHPDYPYIAINDIPKVQNLQTMFPQYYRATPVTVFPQS
ncbi:MAG: peptide-methionine (S)-S-oxide reductase MsrA [Acidocella sp.]|nr:peptide-methionine (S)-S-oxide reductase MsrA [Acidocella sp.]